jgi:hypothetical protein
MRIVPLGWQELGRYFLPFRLSLSPVFSSVVMIWRE